MYHFFVPIGQITEDHVTIAGSDVNHIRNVLRMTKGEQITVFDGRGSEYLCCLDDFSGDVVKAEILSKQQVSSELPVKLYLFQGMPKGDKLDQIIQKSVELGVYRIIPVFTERSIVRLDSAKKAQRTKRYNAIAESAAKQAGRGILPEVASPVSWKEALEAAGTLDRILLPYELAENMDKTRKILSALSGTGSVGIFIGPEGGFAVSETEDLIKRGASVITLGKRILRTETAGPAILAMMMFLLEK